tara:strand:- start:1745 stop:3322 length:1578 start_codon:yes stop_codon:yes gene_type:complete
MTNISPSPYQLIPLLKLYYSNLNGILITDDVGLGKTISAGYILLYSYYKFQKPCIVVCPPNLISKWHHELTTKFNFNVHKIQTTESVSNLFSDIKYYDPNNVIIYLVPNSKLDKIDPNIESACVVFDEIHHYRNSNTKSFQFANNLTKHSNYNVGLTATPINNSFDDLINQLGIVLNSPLQLVDYLTHYLHQSKHKTVNPLLTNFQKQNLGYFFTKRDIQNINIIYPDKTTYSALSTIKKIQKSSSFYSVVTYYRLLASNLNAFYKSIKQPNPIKFDPKIHSLQKLLDKNKPKKVIIFCAFVETVNDLSNKINFENIYTITGNTPLNSRDYIIDEFKENNNSVLILSQVGSEGIDLQFCDFLINYDLHWNPVIIEQRIGRIDRRGQKKSKIQIYNFHVVGSIDDHILRVLSKKINIIEKSGLNLSKIFPPPNLNDTDQLYVDKYIKNEINSSKNFFKSIEKFQSINNHDYSVLDYINPLYCEPNKFTNLIKNNQFKLDKICKNKEWISDIVKQSNIIKEFLNELD